MGISFAQPTIFHRWVEQLRGIHDSPGARFLRRLGIRVTGVASSSCSCSRGCFGNCWVVAAGNVATRRCSRLAIPSSGWQGVLEAFLHFLWRAGAGVTGFHRSRDAAGVPRVGSLGAPTRSTHASNPGFRLDFRPCRRWWGGRGIRVYCHVRVVRGAGASRQGEYVLPLFLPLNTSEETKGLDVIWSSLGIYVRPTLSS